MQGKENKSLAQSSTSLKSSLPLPPLRHQRPSLTFCVFHLPYHDIDFPHGSISEEFAYSGGDLVQSMDQDPLEKGMAPIPVFLPGDRGAWQATVHGVTKSDTTEQLTHHDVENGPSSHLQELYEA